MKNATLLLITIVLVFISISVNAQTKPLVDGNNNPVPQTNGQNANLYDQITNIFQAAIHDGLLKSGTNELQLVSSWYGLQQIFKPAAKKPTDAEYIKSESARNTNISIITGVNNNSVITSFSPSIKYAWNNRDVNNLDKGAIIYRTEVDKAELDMIPFEEKMASELTDLANKESNPVKRKKIQDAITNMTTLASDTTVTLLGTVFTGLGLKLNKADSVQLDSITSKYQNLKKSYDKLVASIAQNSLTTLQGGSLFKNNGLFGVSAKFEYLVGTGWKADKDKPWDFDASLSVTYNKDSTEINPTSLKRQVFSAFVGLNKVLLYTDQQPNSTAATQSLLEIKGSAGASYIPWVRYQKENEWNLNMDFTLSVRLAGNLYLPIEIQYAPATANFLGLFKLQYTLPTVTSSTTK